MWDQRILVVGTEISKHCVSCMRKHALIIRAMLAGARRKFFRSLRVDILVSFWIGRPDL